MKLRGRTTVNIVTPAKAGFALTTDTKDRILRVVFGGETQANANYSHGLVISFCFTSLHVSSSFVAHMPKTIKNPRNPFQPLKVVHRPDRILRAA